MINIGIIGLGRISKKHLNAINKNRNFKLTAVCDIDQTKLDQIKLPKINKYKSIDLMISNENLEMVSILTPSGYHLKNFLEVSKNVKNILVEKPLTTSSKDAKKLSLVAKRNNNRVFVVMQNRFNKPILKLKDFLKKKKLGKIFLSTVRVRWSRDEKYYNLANWRGTKKYDGGILYNQAAHHIDMIRWLNGPISKIQAFKNNLVINNIEHEDTFVGNILFKNGSIGSLEVTVGTRPKDLEGSISFLGTKGSVEVSGFSMDEVKHWDFKKKEIRPNFKKHSHIYGNGHIILYSEIFKAISNKKNICPLLDDGIENINLIEKFYKAVRK